jgi:AcrR family transcriptional regulator
MLGTPGDLNIQRVATAAGVSRSTLYRHFPTRASLEEALREEALRGVVEAIVSIAAEERPPIAVLRRLVAALAEMARERHLAALDLLPLHADVRRHLAHTIVPAIDRVRRAAQISPRPPDGLLMDAAEHLVEECLVLGAGDDEDPGRASARLFDLLTGRLDQGIVVLNPEGRLACLSPRAEQLLDPAGTAAVGEPLTGPAEETLYEDGSPSPASAYPLGVAVRTAEAQSAIRGHRRPGGGVAWISVDVHVLRRPPDGAIYGVVGLLSDVTSEKNFELERLRPPGHLEATRLMPMDIVRTLDEIPAHLFPEQFVAEARRISGSPVALYVLDIDGTHLLRLAGPEEFPDRLDAPLALGPELAEDGMPALRSRLESELPGVAMAPMWIRGRAIGLLLALRAPAEPLADLARHGAVAMELAGGYTDVVDSARRRKETRAAAELQQSMVPPRIARIGGGELAGTVLPSYEVGGDWFDYVENRDGAWLAIADAVGKGPTAGALGGISLAALRASRRSGDTLEEAARAMHEVVFDVGRPEFFVTTIVARWHAVYSTFSWINCGHPPPLIVRSDNTIQQLATKPGLPLGLWERERRFSRRQVSIEAHERLILHSDGITARRTDEGLFGLDGIEKAIHDAPSRSAPALAKAIQEAVMSASEDKLQDDAVAVVLAPTG